MSIIREIIIDLISITAQIVDGLIANNESIWGLEKEYVLIQVNTHLNPKNSYSVNFENSYSVNLENDKTYNWVDPRDWGLSDNKIKKGCKAYIRNNNKNKTIAFHFKLIPSSKWRILCYEDHCECWIMSISAPPYFHENGNNKLLFSKKWNEVNKIKK